MQTRFGNLWTLFGSSERQSLCAAILPPQLSLDYCHLLLIDDCLQSVAISGGLIILIITGIGDMIFICLRLIPALAIWTNPNIKNRSLAFPHGLALNKTYDMEFESAVTIVTYVFDAFQVISQLYLLSVLTSKDFTFSEQIRNRTNQLAGVIMFLIIINFFQWANGSFVEFDIIKESLVNNAIFTRPMWIGLVQFTLPLALFFRIESMHKLIEFSIDRLFRDRRMGEQRGREPERQAPVWNAWY